MKYRKMVIVNNKKIDPFVEPYKFINISVHII